MVSTCANPKCAKPFMRLDGGKVFGFRISHTTEHFWLCRQCAKVYTLRRKEGEIKLVATRKHVA
jgi:hypothetical protein